MNIQKKPMPAFRISSDAVQAIIFGPETFSFSVRNGINNALILASDERGDVGKVCEALRIMENFMLFNGVIRHRGNLSAQTIAGNNGRMAFEALREFHQQPMEIRKSYIDGLRADLAAFL